MKTLIHLFVTALAVIITAYLLPGVHVSGFIAALLAAVVLGILNLFVRPLILLLTLPVNILTLGLFTFFINALMILLAARMVDGFRVDGFLWALFFSLVLSIVSGLLNKFFKN